LDRQEFLGSLSDGLDIGVSALIEADLDEECTRLEVARVQRSLNARAPSIAKAQAQITLARFDADEA
jgi:flagellin